MRTSENFPVDPLRPDKHLNPETHIWPVSEWGAACGKGFISDPRFGNDQVIPRTNRTTTRKWLKLGRQTQLELPA
jgi:hypothetical protein